MPKGCSGWECFSTLCLTGVCVRWEDFFILLARHSERSESGRIDRFSALPQKTGQRRFVKKYVATLDMAKHSVGSPERMTSTEERWKLIPEALCERIFGRDYASPPFSNLQGGVGELANSRVGCQEVYATRLTQIRQ